MQLMDNSYLAINFKVQPISGIEILIAELSLLEFELFEENPNGLVAYISRTNFSKKIFEKVRILNSKEFKINYEIKKIQNKNWNEEWEKNYNQVIINDFCTIRAPFHKPSGKIYDIVIKPEMSFGTGHHETTQLMIDFLFEQDLLEASTQKPIDQEQFMLIEDLYKTVEKLETTQEQNMTNKVNIEFLKDQVEKLQKDVEKLKDKQREFANGKDY